MSTLLGSAIMTPKGCGETINVVLAFDGYAAPTYDVEYRFVCVDGPSGMDQFSVMCADTSTSHRLTIPAEQTRDKYPGTYVYAAYATDTAGTVVIVDNGELTLFPDPTYVPDCKRILEALRAVRSGRATKDQRAIQIDGMQMAELGDTTLQRWEGFYAEQWRVYQQMQRRAFGSGQQNSVRVRFTR